MWRQSFHHFLSKFSLLIFVTQDPTFSPQSVCPQRGKSTDNSKSCLELCKPCANCCKKRVTRLSVYANIFGSVSRILLFKLEPEPTSQAHDWDALCSPTPKEILKAEQLHRPYWRVNKSYRTEMSQGVLYTPGCIKETTYSCFQVF